MSGWVWEFGFWGDFHTWFLCSFWGSRELVGWLLGNVDSVICGVFFPTSILRLSISGVSTGVSFLDESTMYDISFQTHELRVPEISQLIDQSIDGGIYVLLITACCGPGRLCVARELLLVFHGSFLPEHQHQHDNIIYTPTATRHRAVSKA